MKSQHKKRVKKKAEMGIGTLIIFIAMILVAAVAAAVLIQTASALQEKALTTGQQAKAQIATSMRVIEVTATDGQDSTLENFTFTIKLSPGSDPLKLSESSLTFNTMNTTTSLDYLGPVTSASIYCTDNGTNYTAPYCFNTSADGTSGNYTIEYLQQGTNFVFGNLQRGDVIKLYFAAPRAIIEDEQLRLNFIPKAGTATMVQFLTPDVISTERVFLFP